MIWYFADLDLILAQSRSSNSGGLEGLPCMCCCFGVPLGGALIVHVLMAVGMWKVFERAGEPGWSALIPFYNWMIAARIAGRPDWHGLMTLCAWIGAPGSVVALVFMIMIGMDVARSFGRDSGFGVGLGIPLVAPIFWMILGFSESRYGGPVYEENSGYRRRRRRRYEEDDDYEDRPRRKRYRDEDERSRRRDDDEDSGIRRSRYDEE